MKIPKIKVEEAIRAYHTQQELNNADIQALFETKIGSTCLQQMKKATRLKTIEMNKPVFSTYGVNTECFFAAIGIDIPKLERGYARLQKLDIRANQ